MITLTDAVRELLYGNGDLNSQIGEVVRLLAKEDDCGRNSPCKLELISASLEALSPETYTYFSGEDWNK